MEQLSKEDYIAIKTKAYELASKLSKTKIEGLIQSVNENIKNQNARNIFVSTLMFPNDMDLIIAREHHHIHDLTGLEKITLIPKDTILLKLSEYAIYKTQELLEENKELKMLADQASQFDGRYENPQK